MEETPVDMQNELKDCISSLGNLNADELVNKLNDVKHMIDYYNGLTSSIEDRRQRILENASSIVNIALASITIILSISVEGYSYFKGSVNESVLLAKPYRMKNMGGQTDAEVDEQGTDPGIHQGKGPGNGR